MWRLRFDMATICGMTAFRIYAPTQTALRLKPVTLKLRYADFQTITRAKSVPHPIIDGAGLLAVARRRALRDRVDDLLLRGRQGLELRVGVLEADGVRDELHVLAEDRDGQERADGPGSGPANTL